MESLIIREAVEQDYHTIMLLMQQLNSDDPSIEQAVGQALFQSIISNEHLAIYLAEFDGQTVATCYLNTIPNLTRSGRSYALIENVVTDVEHRRNGYGEALLKQVIANAFKLGCYKVMLMTGRDDSVHEFYQRCGFEKESKTAFIKRA